MAAAVNVMPLTSVFSEMETFVVFERAKVAVSVDALGTCAGVQFVLVFQSPERALRFHVALPARAKLARKNIRQQLISEAVSLFPERNSVLALAW